MARTNKITDGTIEISLIEITDPGIIAARGGLGDNRITPIMTFSSSQLANGAALRLKSYPPIVEHYTLNLKDSTQDGGAAQLQALARLLINADDWQLTDWQQTPVYLVQQATNETNTRYGQIIGWSSQMLLDFFNQPFESDSEIDNFTITIVREPFWRSQAPGTMPATPESLKTPGYPYGDTETTSGDGALDVTGDAALAGDWGGAFTVESASDTAFWSWVDIGGVTEYAFQLKYSGDDLAMANGDVFDLAVADNVAGLPIIRVDIKNNSGTLQARARARIDGGGFSSTSYYDLTSGANTILAEWKASTGVGADDGELILTLNGDPKETISGIDNDTVTMEVTSLTVGAVTDIDAGTIGTGAVDDISWDDASPFVAAVRTIDFEQTISYVSNFRQTTQLTHIYNFDDSAAAFGSNLVADPNFELFVVSGSTPGVDDIIYFGADMPFYQFVLNIVTAGSATGATILLEWFNDTGPGWTDSEIGNINKLVNTGSTGHIPIAFKGAKNWGSTTINGQDKFWLRLRISALTTWIITPAQGDEVIHPSNDVYVELNDSQIAGDVPALGALLGLVYFPTPSAPIDWVLMGKKSTDIAAGFGFTSRVNAGGENPNGWSEAYGTDTTMTADARSPGGNNALCDFATDQGLVQRLSLTLTGDRLSNWEGDYRIYARARQKDGVAGDVSIQLRVQLGAQVNGEVVPLQAVSQGTELVGLGKFSILSHQILGDEVAPSTPLVFLLFAKSDNGTTPELTVEDLIIMPINEGALVASWSARSNQALDGFDFYQADSGILRQQITEHRFSTLREDAFVSTPLSVWEARGALMTYQPRRNIKIHFLMGYTGPAGNRESNQGQTLGVQLYTHEQWLSLRGTDG